MKKESLTKALLTLAWQLVQCCLIRMSFHIFCPHIISFFNVVYDYASLDHQASRRRFQNLSNKSISKQYLFTIEYENLIQKMLILLHHICISSMVLTDQQHQVIMLFQYKVYPTSNFFVQSQKSERDSKGKEKFSQYFTQPHTDVLLLKNSTSQKHKSGES